MPNYATNRYRYEQWTGSNAEDVADLLDTVIGETHTGTHVDETGALWVEYDLSMDRTVPEDNYLVISLNYLNQEVTPAQFAEWFVV